MEKEEEEEEEDWSGVDERERHVEEEEAWKLKVDEDVVRSGVEWEGVRERVRDGW